MLYDWIRYYKENEVAIFINFLEGEYFRISISIMEELKFSPDIAFYYTIEESMSIL